MLNAAKTTPRDIVYDLGAGEGRIPIAAARDFGATAVGIEYDPELAALAVRNAERAGVADKVKIIRGDIFREDFTRATVVTLYLLPDLNYQLRPQLLAMKPGTRIVSHMWDMGEWEPDETFSTGGSDAFLWIVPARVAGRWTLTESDGAWFADLDVAQEFQRVGGTRDDEGRRAAAAGRIPERRHAGLHVSRSVRRGTAGARPGRRRHAVRPRAVREHARTDHRQAHGAGALPALRTSCESPALRRHEGVPAAGHSILRRFYWRPPPGRPKAAV